MALLGDSWITRVPTEYLQCEVVKFAKGGASATWFVDKTKPFFTGLVRGVEELRPDIAILHMGGNDIRRGCEVQIIVKAIITVWRRFDRRGISTFVNEVPHRYECSRSNLSREEYDEVRKSVNEELRRGLREGAFIRLHNRDESSLDKDGIHLNRRGNIEFAKRMQEVIEVNTNQMSSFEVVNTLEGGEGGGVRMIFRKIEETQAGSGGVEVRLMIVDPGTGVWETLRYQERVRC